MMFFPPFSFPLKKKKIFLIDHYKRTMSLLHQNINKNTESRSYRGWDVSATRQMTIPVVDTLPATVPGAGVIVFDKDTNKFYTSNGTVWVSTAGESLPTPLESIASLSTSGDEMLYTTAGDTYALSTVTAQARTFMAAATEEDQRAAIGTVIGSDVQAWDVTLQNLSTVTTGADQFIYTTAADTFQAGDFSSFARTLVADSSASDMRTTLDVVAKPTPATSTQNAIPRWDGTSGERLKNSGVVVSDANNVTGVVGMDVTGNFTMSGAGTLDGITAAERSQLANIDATTISSTSWTHVGQLDQDVSTTATPSFSGLGAGSQKVTSVATPTSSDDAATKGYVDGVAGAGLVPTESCRLASTADVGATYNAAAQTLTAAANGQISLDGTSGVNGDRVLIRVEADDKENGIYDVTTQGDGANPFVLTRSSDFNIAASPISQNTYVLITDGVTLPNSSWTLDAAASIANPLTDSVVWNAFSGPTALSGGNGITIAANTVSVDATAAFSFPAGQLDVAAPLSVANGGTGATVLNANNVLVTNGAANAVVTTKAAPGGSFVGTTDVQTLTNKTGTATNNAFRATEIATTGANVVVSGSAPPPGSGYLLLSTGAAAASWQVFATPTPARTFLVSATGGTHTTISAALAAAAALVPAPSVSDPAVVRVGPGVYNEANPLVISTYTALVGIGNFGCVVITPATSASSAIVQAGSRSAVMNLTVSSATGAGGVGIDVPAGASDPIIDHCWVLDCETGFRVTGPSTRALLTTCIFGHSAPGIMQNAILVRNGGYALGTTMRAEGFAGGLLDNGVVVEGSGSSARISDVTAVYCEDSFVVRNGGGVGTEATLELTGCQSLYANTNALRVGAHSIMTCTGTFLEHTTIAVGSYDLRLDASTSQFYGAGNRLRGDLIHLAADGRIVSEAINTKGGDEGVDVIGELHVGTYKFPSESCFGGGDSHTVDMYVYTATPASVFTDRTAAARERDLVTFPMFDGTAVSNACYIGLADTTVSGGFVGIKAVRLTTAAVYGSGGIQWQYWDGAAWTTFNIMARQADASYLPRAEVGALAYLEDQQIRFGDMTGWATNTVNGTLGWWVRIIIGPFAPITTIPVIDQIKLNTSRVEINSDGFVELFGTARSRCRLPWQITNAQAANLSPSNQDVYVSDNLAVGRIENRFVSGANDRIGFTAPLPFDTDTSLPITFRWFWYRTSNTAINWTIRWGWTNESSNLYQSTSTAPATGPNEQNVTKSVPAGGAGQPTTYEQITSRVLLDVSSMLSERGGTGAFGDPAAGDLLWVSINRTDANGGNANIVELEASYVSCARGAFTAS